MFEQLFERPSAVARHANAPYADERRRYLAYCERRGDSRSTLLLKADDLLWVARKLSVYPDLRVTIQQVRAVARHWNDRERACGRRLDSDFTRERFVQTARAWLRYLGYFPPPLEPIPFQSQLDEYCSWARNERGLSDATIKRYHHNIKRFLRWYGILERPLSVMRVNDVDAYLAQGSEQGWCRITVNNIAGALRAFCRYCALQRWTRLDLASAIQGPRIYAMEALPAGPDWATVRRLLAPSQANLPNDVRDRAILMLFAIYGLRAGEVANLRLEHLDWEHDLLRIYRGKRRETQTYPLLPSVGNAILQYLEQVRRRPSTHREVFLTLRSPYGPMSLGALYNVAAPRLTALGVKTAHHGPHCLRHACATRLVADGFSLKEIGDHLGHRSTSATRTYAKVGLPGLREVAAFDLGELL
jgi:site-specific recombinase XerD